MIFSSYQFIFAFLPIALLGFYIVSRLGHRAGAVWLILASIAFYACWRIEFLPILLVSIGFNYLISRLLDGANGRERLQSMILLTGIVCDLLALIYFKYAVAMAQSLGFHSVAGVPFEDIVLPLGISFFTFTQIGYLIDVKQGVARTRDPISYVLFVTFFPHLIAGPILHHREMMPQFADRDVFRFDSKNLAIGLTMFSMGLAKKVLLADPLSPLVASAFAAAPANGILGAWFAVISYSFQLYFDFSGYSDMAIGLARMFNIRFPLNFNSPYKAMTVIDYWQRFHMTLTRFITMYIFSPMALAITRFRTARGIESSRKASATPGGFLSLVAVPTLATMGLAGIWHGAGSQYLIFGLLHGAYITVNHAARVFFPKPKQAPMQPAWARAVERVWKTLAVYVAALVAFAFFRAPSTGAALDVLAGMIGMHGKGELPEKFVLARIALCFLIVWALPNTQQILTRYEPALGRPIPNPWPFLTWKPTAGWVLASAAIAGLSLMLLSGEAEFLYFQF